MARLLIAKGPNTGVSYELGERTRIGRLGENEIQVPDPNVSRIHAEIIREADGQTIYDRGSKNGVIVNGEEVSVKVLEPGDEITIGVAGFIYDGAVDICNARFSCTRVYYVPGEWVTSIDEANKEGNGGGALVDLAGIFAGAPKNVAAAANHVCEGLLSWSGASHVLLILRDYSKGPLHPIHAAPRNKAVFISDKIIKFTAEKKVPVVASLKLDAQALQKYFDDDDETGDSLKALPGQVTCVCAPLKSSELISGKLMFFFNDTDAPPAEIVASIQSVAALTGLAINAARTDKQTHLPKTAGADAEQRSTSSRSLRMQEIYNSARRSADGDAPILITGETGTGKEALAQFIHASSQRVSGPFVEFSCAGVDAEDLEAQLFGVNITDENGNVTVQTGIVDEAAGGTLFMQEVGEMPLAFQPKVLRFLQDRAYCRVNSTCAVSADIKLIASSSIDLAAAVRSGNFREDLWYRLNVVPFHMPPLRERREDVAPLMDFFIQYHAQRLNRKVLGANDSAINLLQKYDWPGNIRELNNAVERAVLLAESKVLSISDFSHIEEARRQLNAKSDLERKRDTRPLAEVERQHIIIALKKHNFNQARAAEALGLHRNTLRNKIIEYGIEIPK